MNYTLAQLTFTVTALPSNGTVLLPDGLTPVSAGQTLNATLLPGLLNSIRHNFNQGIRDVCLFETGRIFAAGNRGELPGEREAIGLVGTGGILGGLVVNGKTVVKIANGSAIILYSSDAIQQTLTKYGGNMRMLTWREF